MEFKKVYDVGYIDRGGDNVGEVWELSKNFVY